VDGRRGRRGRDASAAVITSCTAAAGQQLEGPSARAACRWPRRAYRPSGAVNRSDDIGVNGIHACPEAPLRDSGVDNYFAPAGSALCALDGIDEAVPEMTQAGFLEMCTMASVPVGKERSDG
jgi:hypothetical protein